MIKKIIAKIIYGHKRNSDSYVQYLRSKGMRIGERVIIYAPTKTHIDETRPWLIEIGNDVKISEGVTVLTHGFEWSVLKGVYGEILGSAGKVTIGNNVFIGAESTILKGVNIGDNVIIGAGSLVNKDIPDNCVAAGNPAKVIMSLSEYYEKRQKAQISEAEELVREYRKVYGKEPDESALREFFFLFSDKDTDLPEIWEKDLYLNDNYDKSKEFLSKHTPKFKNMKAFLDSIE